MVRCFLYSILLEKEDARLHYCRGSFVFEACVESPTAVVTDVVTASVTVDVTSETVVTVVTAVLPSGCEPGYEPLEQVVNLPIL